MTRAFASKNRSVLMENEVTILTREKIVVMPFVIRVLSSDMFVSACLSGIMQSSFCKQFW